MHNTLSRMAKSTRGRREALLGGSALTASLLIPGTRNPDHLRENLGAVNVRLTAADVAHLDSTFAGFTVEGGRMNEMQMRSVE